MDAAGLARDRRSPMPPRPDKEAHKGSDRVANEALAKYFLESVAQLFVTVSEALVERRWQYHNF